MASVIYKVDKRIATVRGRCIALSPVSQAGNSSFRVSLSNNKGGIQLSNLSDSFTRKLSPGTLVNIEVTIVSKPKVLKYGVFKEGDIDTYDEDETSDTSCDLRDDM